MVENWVCKCAVMGEREEHADRTCRHFAKEFSVDKVAPATPSVGERSGEHGEVERFPDVELVPFGADVAENDGENEAAVV